MKDFLSSHPVFKELATYSEKADCKAFVVGGFVRDLLLKRESKDIDIVVIGEGVPFAQGFAKHLNDDSININVFENFGTAMLRYKDYEVEFVGARKESYRDSSRKPKVENASFEEDIARRDFTINAMALSLNKDNLGELIDLYGGVKDLKEKIIRTPLNADTTFYDDPLRMMRAIRFASQLNFTPNVEVISGIKRNKSRLSIISQERITDELNKTIMSPVPSVGFKLFHETGLLRVFFAEMSNLYGVETVGKKAHKDNFYHTLEVLDKIAALSDNLWLRWAAILHDIAKPATKKYTEEEGWTFHAHEYIGEKMVKRIFKRLKLPLGENMRYVKKMVRLHLRPIALTETHITDSAVRRLLFEAGDDIEDLMMLCKSDITSKNEAKVQRFLKNFEKVEKKLEVIEEKDRVRNFQPPISGEEIMETFNLTPCREVGIIKNAIKEAILEGIIPNNYKEAYDFMLKEAEKINLYPQKK